MSSALLPGSRNILRESEHLVHAVMLESIDSTDLLARRLIAEAATEDEALPATLILAGSQHRGRGRRGHEWISPTGGLYLNYLRSAFSETELKHLSLFAASALCSFLEALGTPRLTIKWPNDLLFEGGKLGGILCYVLRGEENYASIGLGLNLQTAPDPGKDALFPSRCLAQILPDLRLDPVSLALSFIDALESAIRNPASSRENWSSHLLHRRGDILKIGLEDGTEFEGEFEGVDGEGCLLLRVDGEHRKLSSAEILPA